MLSFLPAPVRGSISFLVFLLNTLFWTFFLFFMTFLKLIIPIEASRKFFGKICNAIAVNWISINNLNLAVTNKIKWNITGLDGLDMNDWYLVIANHQSWSDILVLQKIFNRRIPFLKFFLKKELIGVPIMGQAWWALDFPFMKRYSKDFLKKHPELKGKDLETTKKACEKFKKIPISIMNFVEGTRFSKGKHEKQNSPFTHLLKPRAAGIAFVLSAMAGQLNSILDVTITYPEGVQEFFGFISGKTTEVKVSIRKIAISENLQGDYFEDEEFKLQFQNWLNEFWAEKDLEIGRLLSDKK